MIEELGIEKRRAERKLRGVRKLQKESAASRRAELRGDWKEEAPRRAEENPEAE